jgi:hypothetical protein
MSEQAKAAQLEAGPQMEEREERVFGRFRVFAGNDLCITDDGFEIDIRIPWYRSLPVSSLHSVEITLDGERIDPSAITFRLYGERYTLEDLPWVFVTWWYILDPGTLHVRYDRALSPGKQHTVELNLGFKIPYIMIGPNAHVQFNRVRKTLTAVREDAA